MFKDNKQKTLFLMVFVVIFAVMSSSSASAFILTESQGYNIETDTIIDPYFTGTFDFYFDGFEMNNDFTGDYFYGYDLASCPVWSNGDFTKDLSGLSSFCYHDPDTGTDHKFDILFYNYFDHVELSGLQPPVVLSNVTGCEAFADLDDLTFGNQCVNTTEDLIIEFTNGAPATPYKFQDIYNLAIKYNLTGASVLVEQWNYTSLAYETVGTLNASATTTVNMILNDLTALPKVRFTSASDSTDSAYFEATVTTVPNVPASTMSGAGTLGDPFIITTLEEFEYIFYNTTASYELGADIDFTGYVEMPVSFSGTFEGANKTLHSGSDQLFLNFGVATFDNVLINNWSGRILASNTVGNLVSNNLHINGSTTMSLAHTTGSTTFNGLMITESSGGLGLFTRNDGTITVFQSYIDIDVSGATFENGLFGGRNGNTMNISEVHITGIWNTTSGASNSGMGILGGYNVNFGTIGAHNVLVTIDWTNVGVAIGNLNQGIGMFAGHQQNTGSVDIDHILMDMETSFSSAQTTMGIMGDSNTGGKSATNFFYNTNGLLFDNLAPITNLGDNWVGGVSVTDVTVTQVATYGGWDTNIWNITEGFVPTLKNQPEAFTLSEPSQENPVIATAFTGTDFTLEANTSSVDTPTIEKVGQFTITWAGTNLDFANADLDTFITAITNGVSVDSASLPSGINSSANVSITNIGDIGTPQVLVNGEPCVACTLISFNGTDALVTVPHFSNITIGNVTCNFVCIGYDTPLCLLNDTSTASCNAVNETLDCGIPFNETNLTFANFTNQTGVCDFCTPIFAGSCPVWNTSTCVENNGTGNYSCIATTDANNCFAQTSLPSDEADLDALYGKRMCEDLGNQGFNNAQLLMIALLPLLLILTLLFRSTSFTNNFSQSQQQSVKLIVGAVSLIIIVVIIGLL